MSVRTALLFSFLDRYGGLAVSIASSMVIARLLSPGDLGVYSVAMALLALAMCVRDMGAGQYLVQTKELTQQKIQAVWTIQASIGVGFAALIASVAIPAARFYNEPRMTSVMFVMALSYLATPIGSVTYAMLMREMRYLDIAKMRLTANVTGAVTSVGLAYHGHGPVSLAWGTLAAALANAAAAQAFRPRGMPWALSFRGVSEALRFGGRVAATSIINVLQASVPDFIIGRTLGMATAGLYSRSAGLVGMFNRLVTDAVYTVAVAAMATDVRNGHTAKHSFHRALSYMTALHWIFCVNIVLLAHPITAFLYGHQWEASVGPTRWLALASAILAPVPLCAAVTTALGRADMLVRATGWTAVASVLAAGVGAFISLQAVAMGLCLAAVVSTLVWLRQTLPLVGLRWVDLSGTLAHSLGIAACCAAVPIAIVLVGGEAPRVPVFSIGAALLGGLGVMVASIWVTAHPLKAELQRCVAALERKRSSRVQGESN